MEDRQHDLDYLWRRLVMTGVLNVAVSAVQIRYVVVGINGGAPSRVGWGTAASPGGARGSFLGSTTVNGATLIEVTSDSSFDLIVTASGIQSQSLFARVILVDGTGAGRTFTSAAATFSTAGGNSFWSWPSGSSKVYEAGDSGETRAIQFS